MCFIATSVNFLGFSTRTSSKGTGSICSFWSCVCELYCRCRVQVVGAPNSEMFWTPAFSRDFMGSGRNKDRISIQAMEYLEPFFEYQTFLMFTFYIQYIISIDCRILRSVPFLSVVSVATSFLIDRIPLNCQMLSVFVLVCWIAVPALRVIIRAYLWWLISHPHQVTGMCVYLYVCVPNQMPLTIESYFHPFPSLTFLSFFCCWPNSGKQACC